MRGQANVACSTSRIFAFNAGGFAVSGSYDDSDTLAGGAYFRSATGALDAFKANKIATYTQGLVIPNGAINRLYLANYIIEARWANTKWTMRTASAALDALRTYLLRMPDQGTHPLRAMIIDQAGQTMAFKIQRAGKSEEIKYMEKEIGTPPIGFNGNVYTGDSLPNFDCITIFNKAYHWAQFSRPGPIPRMTTKWFTSNGITMTLDINANSRFRQSDMTYEQLIISLVHLRTLIQHDPKFNGKWAGIYGSLVGGVETPERDTFYGSLWLTPSVANPSPSWPGKRRLNDFNTTSQDQGQIGDHNGNVTTADDFKYLQTSK